MKSERPHTLFLPGLGAVTIVPQTPAQALLGVRRAPATPERPVTEVLAPVREDQALQLGRTQPWGQQPLIAKPLTLHLPRRPPQFVWLVAPLTSTERPVPHLLASRFGAPIPADVLRPEIAISLGWSPILPEHTYLMEQRQMLAKLFPGVVSPPVDGWD